ncbi:MAG TPA: amino acid adenylation domain-containing protein, partial [Herpetosiphonaceae bacterium]
LLRLAAAEYILLLTLHHSIADGWSVGVLSREVAAAYAAVRAGHLPDQTPLPVQYADYARWQRQWLAGPAGARLRRYWQRQLDQAPMILDLPTDRPRPSVQTFDGASVARTLPVDLTAAVERLSQQTGVTVFMTLLAAFATVLSRASRQDDLLIGAPSANRTHAATQELIGCFVNTLALRVQLAGDPRFRELLQRVRATCLGAYAHQDLPFEHLVEALHPERDPSRNPLVQVMLNMHNFEQAGLKLPGITSEIETLPEPDAKFDLSLYAKESSGVLRLELVYNRDLFEHGTVEALLDQIGCLLAQAVAQPEARIGSLSLVTPSMAALLPDPSQPLCADWYGAVHEWFARQAEQTPERIALQDRRDVWSYAALHSASNRLAHCLREQGVGEQASVAIYGQRSAALVWAMLAVLKAGAAFTILDPGYPAARLIATLRAAAPRAVLQLEAAGDIPDELAAFLSEQPEIARLVVPAQADRDHAFGAYADTMPALSVAPDDRAYIAFTSGSTGMPKGIVGSHRPLTHFLRWYADTFRLSADDRFSMLSGLAHDPLLRDIFTPLCLGATLCIPDPDDLHAPSRLLRWLHDEAITVTHITPALAQMLSDEFETCADPLDLPAQRLLCFGGDTLTMRDLARAQRWAGNATYVNFYGATETPQAMGCFIVPPERLAADPQAARVPVGCGIDGVQLLVLNAAGQVAGVGEIGEIWVRTPYLALGYLDDADLTRQRFAVNPWTGADDDRLYRTGDLGRYLADGTLQCLGRVDQQIKIRGFRVEPGEIEAVLAQHPAVQAAAVQPWEDQPPAGGHPEKRLVAYVVEQQNKGTKEQRGEEQRSPSPTGGPSGHGEGGCHAGCHARRAPGMAPGLGAGLTSDLRTYLKDRLPDYMVPSAFVFLDALPLTPNGKLDRKALPAPAALEDEATDSDMPRTPTEELVAGVWRDVLGLGRIGRQQNFFALGGHSLLATQVLSRIRTLFQIELPLRALFERPTVAGLSEALDRARRDATVERLPELLPADRALYRAAESGPDAEVLLYPLSYAQQQMWLLDQLEPDTAAYTIPLAVRLRGPLDEAALRAAFQHLVARQAALRTTFVLVHGQPHQRIAPARDLPLPVHDLTRLAPSAQAEAVAHHTAQVVRQPFDLARGPLLRLALLRLAAAEYILLLTLHHSIADGWSVGVLSREVAAAYAAVRAGHLPD